MILHFHLAHLNASFKEARKKKTHKPVMHHLQPALEGTREQLVPSLRPLVKMQSVTEEGHERKKHICDTLRLVTETLVIFTEAGKGNS